MGRLYVEALHFADECVGGFCRALAAATSRVAVERPQSDASERVALIPGEKQASARMRVGAGQRGKLLVETLEAKVDLEPLRVFDEQCVRELDVARRERVADRGRVRTGLRLDQLVLSHAPTLISLPGKLACSSFSRAMAGAGGSRTTSAVCMTDWARGPTLAPLTPFSCRSASCACAASSLRNTPSEIARRCGPVSIRNRSLTP